MMTRNGAAPPRRIPWQERRSQLLQRACELVAQEVQLGGNGLLKIIDSVAKKFSGSELGSGRRLALAPKTLQQWWYLWNANGRTQSVFALKYKTVERRKTDPLLLRLLIEEALQTGASLAEIVGNLNNAGAKISLQDVRAAFPRGDLRKLERSRRELTEYRLQLEKNFTNASAKWRRVVLKQRTATLRKILNKDAALERRILRQRDQLQRKFLQADARAVRRRERIQRELFSRIEDAK